MAITINKFTAELDHLTEEAMKPIVATIIEVLENEMRHQKPDPLNPIAQQIKKFHADKPRLEKELLKGFSDQEARQKVQKGIELIFKEIKMIEGGEKIHKEFRASSETFAENIKNKHLGASFELGNRSFYQQILNLSDECIDLLCTYAMKRYETHQDHEHDLENTKILFFLLTEFNPYMFQPWVYYGISCLKQNLGLEALRSFAMASLLDFDQCLPHLYTAYAYCLLHNKAMAQKAWELAVSLASDQEKIDYADMIAYVKKKSYT